MWVRADLGRLQFRSGGVVWKPTAGRARFRKEVAMNTVWAIVGVLVVLLVVADLAHHWKIGRQARRDPLMFRDWQAEERRRRVASLKAPAAKGFEGQKLRRRSS